MRTPMHLRLEPLPAPDLEAGLRARIADPVWFLARQWQLGEHEGEDASSPVVVYSHISHTPLRYDPQRPKLDPTVIPAEALIEAEPGDWWTIGRRIRLGRLAAPLLQPHNLAALRFGALPTPYEGLAGELDGHAVFASGLLAGQPLWNEVPSPAADRWSPRRLSYAAPFTAGEQQLEVTDHDGGDVDWFSLDASGEVPAEAPPASRRAMLPGRISYPGAPHPRWWQIEDHAVDIGGFAPDSAHLGTALLHDVALAHSDDWYWFPVPAPLPPPDGGAPPPSAGSVVRLLKTEVRDSFDEVWDLTPPPVEGADAWSLFHTRGLDVSALVVWPVASAPHQGPLLDEVLIGIDEDANAAWAVELSAEGRQLLANAETLAAEEETRRTGTRNFRYQASTTLPPHWHPYRRMHQDRLFGDWQQGIVADLTGPQPVARPGPTSRLIGGPSGTGVGRGHEIAANAISSSGLALRRRARLARDTAGRPVLWVERSVRPIIGPPTSHLRFDVFVEDAAPGGG